MAAARSALPLSAKSLTAPYEAGQRGFHWLKLKRAQTLDLVVLAAEWGSGRREGWLSNLHLGARDPQSGGFVMLGKTFKGLQESPRYPAGLALRFARVRRYRSDKSAGEADTLQAVAALFEVQRR